MGAPTRTDGTPDLTGLRVLIVEDDPLLLMELELVVSEAGAVIAGLCRSVDEAMPAIEGGGLDAAILDFGLGRGTAAPLAERLAAAGVPFCFYTGQVSNDPRLAAWRDCVLVQKPAAPQTIVAAIAGLVADGPRRSSAPAEV
jgi:DNA-binding response OmpR family regulator